MIELLIELDKHLFSILNGWNSPLFDQIMYSVSNKYIWIPLYLFLIYLILKKTKKPIITLIAVFALVGLSDICASQIAKPNFERLRPCHDPSIEFVHTVNNKCGKQYGFFSSHASTSASIAVFFFLLLSSKKIKYSTWILPWGALIGYSRIYLGVHFPLDVFTGFLCGGVLALSTFSGLKKIRAI